MGEWLGAAPNPTEGFLQSDIRRFECKCELEYLHDVTAVDVHHIIAQLDLLQRTSTRLHRAPHIDGFTVVERRAQTVENIARQQRFEYRQFSGMLQGIPGARLRSCGYEVSAHVPSFTSL